MEHQFRPGIYRPKAQRLSISLAPLVTQRSLMFRIKTDLATKSSYTELSPMEETPALHSFCESIQIVSAVSTAMMTAMSATSVYSQESWKSASSFVSMVKVDPRRMAIAFSPGVQWWSDTAEGDGDNKVQVTTPIMLSASTLQPDVSFKEDNNTTIHSEADVALSGADDAGRESVRSFDVATVEKRRTKRNIDEQSAKRPKSAFKKIIFMFQPPKREPVKNADAVVVPNNLPSMDFKLPELKLSPMLYSFLDQINTSPLVSQMPSTPSLMAPSFDTLVEGDVISPENKGHISCKSSPAATYFPRRDQDNMTPFPSTPAGPLKPVLSRSARIVTRRRKTCAYPSRMPSTPSSVDTFVEENATRVRALRATMPPTMRKAHRRYRSSPVVTHFHKWDKDNMPPLPPMPAGTLISVVPAQ